MPAKEDVQINPLFPRLTVGLIHVGPNRVIEKRGREEERKEEEREGRQNIRFRP